MQIQMKNGSAILFSHMKTHLKCYSNSTLEYTPESTEKFKNRVYCSGV